MAVQDGGQLRKGIELSKRLQRAILRHGCFPVHPYATRIALLCSTLSTCSWGALFVTKTSQHWKMAKGVGRLVWAESMMCSCSDGGLLLVSKAGQERAKFRWYDMTRNEVSNKVCAN